MIRKAVIGAAAAVLGAASFLGAMPSASATHVTPLLVSGNPSCVDGLKIEPVQDGTFGPVTIDVTGSTFSFTTDGTLVNSVVVKGGPNANLYDYSGEGGVTSDSGLHSPINPKTGNPYGLSHLCFFLGGKTPPPPK
jgi:hypothetical protein